MMEVKTPEELLRLPKEKILWHHGTCDHCNARLTLVCHFGYDQPMKASFRICKNCLYDNIQYILYGGHSFKNALVDL